MLPLVLFGCLMLARTNAVNLTIGLILPQNNSYNYSIPKVLPAVEYALEEVGKNILANRDIKISVITKDSRRSDIYGPLAAIEIYRKVNVFFGPIYGYAVAPIARYSPYWNVPVITPGAQAVQFENKQEYKLLTRVSATYQDATLMLNQLAEKYSWRKFGLYYHNDPDSTAGKSDCYMAIWGIHDFLTYELGDKDIWTYKFDEKSEEDRKKHGQALENASKHVRCKSSAASEVIVCRICAD